MKKKSKIPVEIFTDGSLDNTNKSGGFGIVLLFGEYKRNITSKSYKNTGIFRMELKAIIHALEMVEPGYDIYIYSDCKNAIDFINNKLTHAMSLQILGRYPEPELWLRFLEARGLHQKSNSWLSFSWVRGHNGNKHNEMADKLAGEAARGSNKIKCKTNN